MDIKSGKFGSFLGCSGYPDCKNIRPINKKTGHSCPTCKEGDVIEKRTKKGKTFYGCDNYPDCEFAAWDLKNIESDNEKTE
jgi:DNA topoisomerase-1